MLMQLKITRVYIVQCMEEAEVDGALIVQPINHKFDHSYVTRSVDHVDVNIL